MPVPYKLLAPELIEVAEKAEEYFRGMGFSLSLEKQQVGFPRIPAFIARRGPTTLVVEVSSQVDSSACEDWIYFARSCAKDTRIVLCLREGLKNFEKDSAAVRRMRLGLYVVRRDHVDEICAPHDLTVTIDLPPLAKLARPIRAKLGPSYEKFSRGDWQEGFEDACQVLEQDCRAYLWEQIRDGHVNIVNATGVINNPTKQQISKMTLGALAVKFGAIQFPSPDTASLAQILSSINADRIGVVHKKRKRTTEIRLRRNINVNMWKVINGLRKF